MITSPCPPPAGDEFIQNLESRDWRNGQEEEEKKFSDQAEIKVGKINCMSRRGVEE